MKKTCIIWTVSSDIWCVLFRNSTSYIWYRRNRASMNNRQLLIVGFTSRWSVKMDQDVKHMQAQIIIMFRHTDPIVHFGKSLSVMWCLDVALVSFKLPCTTCWWSRQSEGVDHPSHRCSIALPAIPGCAIFNFLPNWNHWICGSVFTCTKILFLKNKNI